MILCLFNWPLMEFQILLQQSPLLCEEGSSPYWDKQSAPYHTKSSQKTPHVAEEMRETPMQLAYSYDFLLALIDRRSVYLVYRYTSIMMMCVILEPLSIEMTSLKRFEYLSWGMALAQQVRKISLRRKRQKIRRYLMNSRLQE